MSASHPRCPLTQLHRSAVDQLHGHGSSFLHHITVVVVNVVVEPSLRFSSDCLATLSHFNVHLMPDGPRLQLDVDEIILTLWHVSVLAGMCRIAFLKLKTAIFKKRKET